jgi:hypothetical protein
MVQVDDPRLELARRIFASYEEGREDWRRDHLGASQIGKECLRALWYGFRWWTPPKFPGRVLRLFERGNREEPWLVEDMRSTRMEVVTGDEQSAERRNELIAKMVEAGHHVYFQEAREGEKEGQVVVRLTMHFGGSMDALVNGVPLGGKKWHVWECKTAGAKPFRELAKKGVQVAKPEHYAQMQTYMLGTGLESALYIAVCKDNDEIHVERIAFDRKYAEGLVAKANSIVYSARPPVRISEDPSWYKCRFCDYREACHGDAEPEVNCRTCRSATVHEDGAWRCDGRARLTSEVQREACGGWEAIS